MGRRLILARLFFLGILLSSGHSYGASFYPNRLDDPAAVYLTPENFAVQGDGVADDSAALQQAIDMVASNPGAGVLFVPPGTYRLTKTVYVWPGVRLIGYGDRRPFYVTNEAELKTWVFTAGPAGTLADPKLFAYEGGESVAVDDRGHVYLAAGQILVFDAAGRRLGTVEVPQRPTCLVLGGPERRTLFITARSSLYRLRLVAPD